MGPRLISRRSPAVGLILLALVGLALSAFDWGHALVSWTHIRTALGESLIVAAALGLTVDYFYKRELARDAFEASLGYLLPGELKAELRWIYGQQLIAVEHEMRVVLSLLDDHESGAPRRVRVEFETWRTIRNVSNERVEHPTFASVEEWFRGEDSDISVIECIHRGRRYLGGELVAREADLDGDSNGHSEPSSPALAPSRLDWHRPGIERALGARVVLEPGEQAVFRYGGHEVHYDSGAFQYPYGAPTCRPAVRVEAPPGLRAEVWFGNRGRSEVTEIGGRYVLPNVLLPFQPIVIRWWPEDKHAEWRRRRGEQPESRTEPESPAVEHVDFAAPGQTTQTDSAR
jgi:hypothetical protein